MKKLLSLLVVGVMSLSASGIDGYLPLIPKDKSYIKFNKDGIIYNQESFKNNKLDIKEYKIAIKVPEGIKVYHRYKSYNFIITENNNLYLINFKDKNLKLIDENVKFIDTGLGTLNYLKYDGSFIMMDPETLKLTKRLQVD